MIKVFSPSNGNIKIPIKLWLDDIEEEALIQINNLANLPFAFHHIAIMPDCHSGYGMPIGGVLACNDVIIPNAVGVDIGCGMCAVKTPWNENEIDINLRKKIIGEIRKQVPVGFNHHKEKQDEKYMPSLNTLINNFPFRDEKSICIKEYNNALTQLGSLGGGNHFIELQKDESGNIWIMIHSGSRNFGLKVAKYYNEIAKSKNEQWHVPIPKSYDLAYLPISDEHGDAYIKEMQYCVDFAFTNRQLMMERITNIMNEQMKWKKVNLSEMINIAHNYASLEHHFGKNVWVHRKGATLARKNIKGIIPGSQGSKSYIVIGKENPDSFYSCSHGAGRKMSRTKAQKDLDLNDEIKKLNDLGVIHGIRTNKDLDEASGAYKDIDLVMKNQEDLITILHTLQPLAVIKG